MLSSDTDEVNDVSDSWQETLNNAGMLAMVPDLEEKDVFLSRRIEAESSRVFYALSIPEYIEAWLLVPGEEELRLVFELDVPESFHIQLYRAEALQASIRGSCFAVNASQIKYRWNTTSSAGTTETLVDMRLLCAPRGCVLGLKHSGFRDAVESAWHREMWHQSLEKLSRLMKKN
jgi:uncharacterized protein YndB with AHSA1/START domain